MDALAPTGPVTRRVRSPVTRLRWRRSACLTEVAQPGIHETLTDRTTQLANSLLEAAEDAGIPLVVTTSAGCSGFFFTDAKTVTCYQDVVKCDVERFKRFFHLMLEEGVYLRRQRLKRRLYVRGAQRRKISITPSTQRVRCLRSSKGMPGGANAYPYDILHLPLGEEQTRKRQSKDCRLLLPTLLSQQIYKIRRAD